MIHDLMDPLFPLAALALAAAVALALVGFRDPKAADEHDLSDYHAEPTAELEPRRHAPIPAQRRPWAEMNAKPERDILPPAPLGMNAGSPLYAGMLFDTWHPESPADTADRFLRELRDEARAELAGVA